MLDRWLRELVAPHVQPDTVAVPEPKPAPTRGGGYSLSDHVQQYYKTTRI